MRFAWLLFITALIVPGFLLAVSGCTAGEPGQTVPLSDNSSSIVPGQKPWPHINEFTSSAENITLGENVTLKWDVTDANVINIDTGVGKVQPSGSVQVAPQRSTRYTLTAIGGNGISIAWVVVNVPEKITLLPDLVITGITYNSGLLYYTIKNIGDKDAGPSDTYLYDQSKLQRDTSWVNGLKVGEEKSQAFTNFNYHGKRITVEDDSANITVCADGDNVIAESNEDNNCFIPAFGFKFGYDFAQYASRATWRGSAGRLEYGLAGGSSTGSAAKLNTVAAEDGQNYENVIEMVTPPESYGWVEGVFGDWQEGWQTGGYMLPLELPHNARFTARVGFVKDGGGSGDVTFLFGLSTGGPAIIWYPGVKSAKDGTLESVDIDLSPYNGKKVMPVLRVEGGVDPGKNYAIWIEPRISQ